MILETTYKIISRCVALAMIATSLIAVAGEAPVPASAPADHAPAAKAPSPKVEAPAHETAPGHGDAEGEPAPTAPPKVHKADQADKAGHEVTEPTVKTAPSAVGPSLVDDLDLKEALAKRPVATNTPEPGLNLALTNPHDKIGNANLLPTPPEQPVDLQMFQSRLDLGRQFRRDKQLNLAETNLVFILQSAAPEEMKRTALLELAFVAQDMQKYTRAQQIFAQYLKSFPDDPSIPEVLLRQGLLYRQMGANVLALSKFYAVMSSSLNLKLDRLEYYKRIVLQAQTEIADTYYLQGKYEEAADYLSRLLRLDTKELNNGQILYKLVRALYYQGHYTETTAQAEAFLARYAANPEQPEVRFLLADALKKLGRTQEAMQQVLLLLQSQEAASRQNPENWVYWQQRTGNEIGNQLYKEGDYVNALEVYLNLSPLDTSPTWQLPIWYQIGLIYERLQQPQKAADNYARIVAREKEITDKGTPSPSLAAVIDMARWRKAQLGWQIRVDGVRQQLEPTMPLLNTTSKTNL